MTHSAPVSARRSLLACIWAGVALALFASGCGPAPSGEEILSRQPFDSSVLREIPLPEISFFSPLPEEGVPKRIVSLIPSVTELIFVLELGDRLVGRSHWCDWPPETQDLPDLGGLQTLSKEGIVDLRPDLVVLFRGLDEMTESLRRDFDLQVVTPPTETRDQALEGILEVSAALGVPDRGRRVVDELNRGLAEVSAKWSEAGKPNTLVVLDRSSWWVPGKTSFVHELLEIAGGVNLAATLRSEQTWPNVTLERILDWDPEVILDLSIGSNQEEGQREAAKFWSRHPELPALRDGRVYLLQAGVLVRPGPRMATVADRLGEIIHEGS